MCLPSILVLGLDTSEKAFLQNVDTKRLFGVAIANRYGGIPLIKKLQLLRLVGSAGVDPHYGHPRWMLTYCGKQAATLLNELENNPLFREVILADYKKLMIACPFTKPHHRTNPNWCDC